jgi:tetratricopeptide (TPR) repeat protein
MVRIVWIMPIWLKMPGMVLATGLALFLGVRSLRAAPPQAFDETAPGTDYPTTDTPYAAPLGPSAEPVHLKSPAPAAPVRSEQLEAIAREADAQTRHGFELAGRGAYYAARSEFITALRLMAQGLDADEHTTNHGKSLAAGLTALKEAEDFIPHGAKIEADLNLRSLIGGHVTPALKDQDAATLTPLAAMKAYLTFAQRQLAEAAGHETAGAMALHALGKLHEQLAQKKTTGLQITDSKAVVFYQAALTVCPESFMTANDLGVLLGKNGNYEDARRWLERSASLTRSPTVWNNLAAVYERLGRNDLAARARQQILVAQANPRATNPTSAAGGNVRWVGPEAFGVRGLPAGANAASAAPALAGATVVAQPTPRTTAANPLSKTTSGPLTPWQRDASSNAQNSLGQTVSATSGPMLTKPTTVSPATRPAATKPAAAASGVLTPWQRDSAPPAKNTQDGIWR